MPEPDSTTDLQGPLTTLRIIWAAILMGLITVTAVMVFLTLGSSADEATADAGWPLLTMIAGGMLLTCIPMAYFIRNQTYKKHWSGGAVEPAGYISGNIVFFALIEGPGILAAVGIVVHGGVFPEVLPLIVAAGVILANFPTGGPLQTQAPRLGESEQ